MKPGDGHATKAFIFFSGNTHFLETYCVSGPSPGTGGEVGIDCT